jgi:hypothetical protein
MHAELPSPVIGAGGTALSQSVEFTRPTLTAVKLPSEPRFRRLVYEDSAYRFVARDYGSREDPTIPGLFVHNKQRDGWIQILSLSTEHARLGTPRPLSYSRSAGITDG